MSYGRSKSQKARDRLIIGRLYLRGYGQPQIAKLAKVSQPTVSRDLSYLRIEWQRKASRSFSLKISQELAKLDQLELEYWQAWERSKKPKTSRASEGAINGENGDVKTNKIQRKEEDSYGDPRYLEGVERCIEKRCKLLGLFAPEKIAPTDPSGTRPYVGDLEKIERILRDEPEAQEQLASLFRRLSVEDSN
jgi:predicted transcriptional regulator